MNEPVEPVVKDVPSRPPIERRVVEATEDAIPAATASARLPDALILRHWASGWWLLLVALAVGEITALWARSGRTVSDQDWQRAAEFIQKRFLLGDAISSAPRWTDPTMRLHLGHVIQTRGAARSELVSFERLWVLSIDGQRPEDAPKREPDLTKRVGAIQVLRYDFGPSPVVIDLVDALPQAQANLTRNGKPTRCRWRARAHASMRGGLGQGPAPPAQRFVCDPKRPWLWVGETVIEDLNLRPRRCIWQHPAGPEPVSLSFPNVHLGNQITLFGGLFFYHERKGTGAPVTMRVLVDGQEIGTMLHKDGEGFKRVQFDTRVGRAADAPARGTLRVEVSTTNPYHRSFCWAGTIRDTTRREGS